MTAQLKAQFVLEEDPQEAMWLHQINNAAPSFQSFFRKSLRDHRLYRDRYPKEACEERKKYKKFLAYNVGVREYLTISQLEEATGDDQIPEPPQYRDSLFCKNAPRWSLGSYTVADRLDGWALFDSDKLNPSNPLKHDRCMRYWQRHDPDCLKKTNPFRKNFLPSNTMYYS